MGGHRRFLYPKYVWSPAGGWWTNPADWKKHTVKAGAFVALSAAGLFVMSAATEVGVMHVIVCMSHAVNYVVVVVVVVVLLFL
jgi:hypothetical protein